MIGIFFDLEAYVPEVDRKNKDLRMKGNPHKPGHYLLGGVFAKTDFLGRRPSAKAYEHFWLWDEEDFDPSDPEKINKAEKQLVTKIHNYWAEISKLVVKRVKGTWKLPKLVTIGTGIARYDLPMLYIKSLEYGLDTPEKSYELYHTTMPVDMTNVGMGIIENGEKSIPLPVPTLELMKLFDIQGDKESGTKVWDYFDNKEYTKIEKRTIEEVKVNVEMYFKIKDKTTSRAPKFDITASLSLLPEKNFDFVQVKNRSYLASGKIPKDLVNGSRVIVDLFPSYNKKKKQMTWIAKNIRSKPSIGSRD